MKKRTVGFRPRCVLCKLGSLHATALAALDRQNSMLTSNRGPRWWQLRVNIAQFMFRYRNILLFYCCCANRSVNKDFCTLLKNRAAESNRKGNVRLFSRSSCLSLSARSSKNSRQIPVFDDCREEVIFTDVNYSPAVNLCLFSVFKSAIVGWKFHVQNPQI